MTDRARGAAAAEAQAPLAAGDWFEQEGSLGGRSGVTVARVFLRAGGSWPLWVMGALILAGLVARSRARKEFIYEATVVLRVDEGEAVADRSGILSLGELRDQIEELAFSRDRIIPIIKKYKLRFDKQSAIDAPEAVATFRTFMTVTLAENDFIEDDQSSNARRSARVAISFRHPNNERAHAVARELAELVVSSGFARQKTVLEAEAKVTRELLRYAAADLAKIRSDLADWARLKPAVERFTEAQKAEASAALALRALAGRQAIAFELVDPGRVPPLIDRQQVMITAFFFALFATLLAGSLLAGVFDPRVLDGDDLAALGVDVLGRLPALPAVRRGARAPASGSGEQPEPRV